MGVAVNFLVKRTFDKVFKNLSNELNENVNDVQLGIYFEGGVHKYECFKNGVHIKNIDVNAVFGAVKSKEIILNFLSRKLDKISLNLEGKFIGEMAKLPIKKDVSINYTLQEVLDESKKPSMPCDLKS